MLQQNPLMNFLFKSINDPVEIRNLTYETQSETTKQYFENTYRKHTTIATHCVYTLA